MKIYIGSDHAGWKLKLALVEYLKKSGYTVVDKGAHGFTLGDDYPDFIFPVAHAVAADMADGKTTDEVRGIVIGGSGQGEAMTANRVRGARAIEYYGGGSLNARLDIIKLSREHNDANILSLGARFVSVAKAKKALDVWLATRFSQDPRHIRRIKKMDIGRA